MTLTDWLLGSDTGLSSMAIAAAAAGKIKDGSRPPYPHDCDDFGRCSRLLANVPEARAGLDRLATAAGPYWQALISRWSEIETAYQADRQTRGRACYGLMRSILQPIEDADRNVVRLGAGMSIRFGA